MECHETEANYGTAWELHSPDWTEVGRRAPKKILIWKNLLARSGVAGRNHGLSHGGNLSGERHGVFRGGEPLGAPLVQQAAP